VGLPALFESRDLADVGVFGGSGFYNLLTDPVERVSVQTPYGAPSDAVTIARVGDVRVAFLPRHGPHHLIPPHAINYRANVWAMAQLGVRRLIAPTAAGSLQPGVRPGDFVVCDQFVDRTYGRAQTFYDGPRVAHVSTADPYCPELRAATILAAQRMDIRLHERGTVVVIQGPRFSTRAESQWFSRQGWAVINMTQYPEVALARELALCYVNISLITDYDAGLEGEAAAGAVTVHDVVGVMRDNNFRVRQLIERLLSRLAGERSCPCPSALDHAVVG